MPITCQLSSASRSRPALSRIVGGGGALRQRPLTIVSVLRSKDLTRLLDLVHAVNEAPDGDYLRVALAGAARLIPAETVSYNEMVTAAEERNVVEPEHPNWAVLHSAYLAHVAQHPLHEVLSTGRLAVGEPVAVSDLVGGRAFRASAIYREYFQHRDVEDQLVVLVAARSFGTQLIAFNRSRRGFGTRDRAAAAALVPHLRQAIRHRRRLARLHAVAALVGRVEVPDPAWDSLTPREREVIDILASGATDGRIGRVLGISGRTVGKHLEHIYRKLEVPGRSAVAGLARRRAG